jgi:hypothetical protein
MKAVVVVEERRRGMRSPTLGQWLAFVVDHTERENWHRDRTCRDL